MCRGGTGATIDKILDKIGLDPLKAAKIRKTDQTVHHIAAKCGVFAETDVVGLLKAGVDREAIFISLCAAIVKQNLEVLVRGNVLKDKVLLLGGPHTYLPALTDVWREMLPETWKIHKWEPQTKDLKEAIFVPEDSQYFAATGAVLFGRKKAEISINSGENKYFENLDMLDNYISSGRIKKLEASGAVVAGLVQSDEEIKEFAEKYSIPKFAAPTFEKGSVISCYLGIDGGSTSTKLALIDDNTQVIYKDYILSSGNPIDDVRKMFVNMLEYEKENGIKFEVKGSAVTGYASSILRAAFDVDRSIVETVAHMKSSVAQYGEVDMICDVGGQDIKVLFMKHGRVVDFRLNTQCSAGNGLFSSGNGCTVQHSGREICRARFQGTQKHPLLTMVAPFSWNRIRLTFNSSDGQRKRSWRVLPSCFPRTSGTMLFRNLTSQNSASALFFRAELRKILRQLRLRWTTFLKKFPMPRSLCINIQISAELLVPLSKFWNQKLKRQLFQELRTDQK